MGYYIKSFGCILMAKQKIMKKTSQFLLLLMISFTLPSTQAYPQGDECCSRHAVHGKYILNDPMGIVGAGDALQASVENLLQESLTRNCFHFLQPAAVDHFIKKDVNALAEAGNKEIYIPNDLAPNEYSFEAQFVSGLDEFTNEGRPIRSRLKVEMYFEGEQRELVHSWQTQGTWDTPSNSGTSWLGHRNKFKKLAKDPDIMEIIKKFEKQPVQCKLIPEKENVNPGEVIKIKLTGFLDKYGEKSREFNRVLVHAYSGEILNGEENDNGPDYKVFRLGDGDITLKYRAPDNCDDATDRITIYNSCDILPDSKIPMSQTQIHNRLLEKTLNINCYDATLTIRKKVNKKLFSSFEEERHDGSCVTHIKEKHTIDEPIEVVVNVTLKLEEAQDIPVLNQTMEYYKPQSVTLSTFNYHSKEYKYYSSRNSGLNCAGGGSETTINYTRNAGKHEIEGKPYSTQTIWMVVFDNETGKAVKIIPGGYSIGYEVHEQEKLHSVIYTDKGPKEDNKTTSKQSEKTFELGPVGEEITDPTIKKSNTWVQDYLKRQGVELPAGITIPAPSNEETIKKIPPDILVSNGDGKTSFGGEGKYSHREKVEHGYLEITKNYSWHMTRRKK